MEIEIEIEIEIDVESDGDDDDDGLLMLQMELFGVIEDGDYDVFECVLREDVVCVKDVNLNGWMAAYQAAYSGEYKMLRRVFEFGVDVNVRCVDGCLVVYYVSVQGEKKCL